MKLEQIYNIGLGGCGSKLVNTFADINSVCDFAFMNSNSNEMKHLSNYSPDVSLNIKGDGTGRDTYVIKNNAGLTKKFKSLNQYRLKDFLRTPESCIFNFKSNPMKEGYRAKTIYVSEKELSRNKHIKTIENGLVKRLYKDEKYKFIPRLETETIDTGKNRFCLMKEYAMGYGRTQSCRCRTTPNHNTYEQKFFRNGKKKVKLSLLEI